LNEERMGKEGPMKGGKVQKTAEIDSGERGKCLALGNSGEKKKEGTMK